ncbi:DUF1120 domain-containing protein [Burkholderia cepacia]|uniref:DUF1120 domain-containing protein n=1 Tax=Burkholderia cepacia GG4 TaxID=1009846 RepID=A0A9W3K7J4_BURCE|nr:DUF1120 domain-containing protein [Burkholderia cepacia]AFQ50032.1 hypothetical protein GEM_3642 [Burkholderia cepacia GG4]
MHLKHLPVPSLLASALLLSTGHALAGTDLSVSGRIQSGACSLTLGNGGTIDLGTISRKDLNEAEETIFSFKYDLPLNIQCQAPTKVAIKVVNNREDVDYYGNRMYGLGPSGSKNRYWFYPFERFGDGKPLSQLVSFDDRYWGAPTSSDTAEMIPPSWLSSWAEPGQTLPQAFQNISSRLLFNIAIAPAKDLDLSQEIVIDGSATMELVYL